MKYQEIQVGNSVVMPEPILDDAWSHGGFLATVIDVLDNGNLLVEDQDSDIWEIQPDRVEIAG